MAVKEETMAGSEMDKGNSDHHDTSVALDHGDLMQQMFSQSYRPLIPEGGHHVDDFFADLAELESDPMSLIFPGCDPGSREKAAPPKGLGADPLFNMLDWGATNVVATSAGSSFEQGCDNYASKYTDDCMTKYQRVMIGRSNTEQVFVQKSKVWRPVPVVDPFPPAKPNARNPNCSAAPQRQPAAGGGGHTAAPPPRTPHHATALKPLVPPSKP
ncbi:putative WRKY transcription factor 14 [Panicum miliaceum]|uniref:WRKY transcription factor 14 n=1 Tax=Panicum miliaceum TaxID=4540 RepID=A0A3L6QIN7_PANMI|nr:putative WRKY transcription factor 14 [Panicum miliaceum]